MGQGHYSAVGYGVILDKKLWRFEESEANSDKLQKAMDAAGGIRSAYESKSPYWAIFIYDGAEGGLPPTQSLADFANVKVPAGVKKRWERFCKVLEMDLKPELLWIEDYD